MLLLIHQIQIHQNRCIILEKSSLLLIPDCGRYEALNVVFSGMMNAGDEMVQNTGHFLSHRHISPENDHDDLSSIEKYALRATK